MTSVFEMAALEYWLYCNPPSVGPGYAACWQAACRWQREAIKNQGEPVAEIRGGDEAVYVFWLGEIPKQGTKLYTAPTIPEGWQLVPVEPTLEMLDAGDQYMGGLSSLGEAWGAMLSAAPKGEQP